MKELSAALCKEKCKVAGHFFSQSPTRCPLEKNLASLLQFNLIDDITATCVCINTFYAHSVVGLQNPEWNGTLYFNFSGSFHLTALLWPALDHKNLDLWTPKPKSIFYTKNWKITNRVSIPFHNHALSTPLTVRILHYIDFRGIILIEEVKYAHHCLYLDNKTLQA